MEPWDLQLATNNGEVVVKEVEEVVDLYREEEVSKEVVEEVVIGVKEVACREDVEEVFRTTTEEVEDRVSVATEVDLEVRIVADEVSKGETLEAIQIGDKVAEEEEDLEVVGVREVVEVKVKAH